MIFEGLYYKIVHKYDSRVLDGKESTDEVYLNDWNKGDYQQWSFEEVSDGWYKIIHKCDNRVLDGKGSTDEVYLNNWNKGDYQQWSFEEVGDGWYKIIHKYDKRVLDGKGSTDEVYLNKWNSGDYQQWKLELVDVEIKSTIKDIIYGDMKIPTTYPVDLFVDMEVDNPAPTTITKTISKSITKTCTFEWGFTETLTTGMTTTFEAGIPLIGSTSTELSVEFTLESHQTTTKSTEETYEITDTIEIPPYTCIRATGYYDWADDITTDFTAIIIVTGQTPTATGTRQLTGTELANIIKEQGFTGTLIENDEYKLVVKLNGKFNGAYGLTSHFKTERK